MPFVIDASVTLAWCFEDEVSDYAEAVLAALSSEQALAPNIWTLEVTNALVIAERRKRITADKIAKLLAQLKSLAIGISATPDYHAFDALHPIAKKYQLSCYDAAYLDLALKEHCPLATLDSGLIDACKQAKVKVWNS